jgi:Uma2 family endonuclease
MADPADRRATCEDLLQVPEHLVAEIIDGRLVTHPRPAPRHLRASSSLGGELHGPFDKGRSAPGDWWILGEPELHLGPHVLVPDLAGWRRERMPGLPDTAWFELAPDWVWEVLSPGTASQDRAEKLPIYADQEIAHAWPIDPLLRTLEAFENRDGKWLLLATLKDADPVSLPPFDAVTFDLSLLWAV